LRGAIASSYLPCSNVPSIPLPGPRVASLLPTPEPAPPFDVSVIVPVYGGEATIGALVEQVREVLSSSGFTHEVILVCDRPRDASWSVARALAQRHDDVTAIHLRRNYGQHPATLLGIRAARGATVVTMDEDLQHAPLDVPAIVRASRERGAIVYGIARTLQHEAWRNLASRAAKVMLRRYLGFSAATDLTAFRAFPVGLRDAFARYQGESVAIDVLLSWSGAPSMTLACEHAPRREGRSGYTLRKLLNYLADLAVGYSTAPLRAASALGIAAMLLALALSIYALVNWFIHGSAVPGFAFLAISISIFAGAQLLAIGVMGEYLGRLYVNSLAKPQYTVDEVVRRS
jgi:undecaprenyl-phosphate 4-deoxy-4-formamido-L-arabinose transferase